MRIEVSTEIDAPRSHVWDVLTDWEAQSAWMRDAKSVEVVTEQREGVGVTISCPTNVVGATVLDVMRVTGWRDKEHIEVTHIGRVIKGVGAFELEDAGPGRTRFTWWEEVDPPLGAVGRLGARLVVAPYVTRLFEGSLRDLKAICEESA